MHIQDARNMYRLIRGEAEGLPPRGFDAACREELAYVGDPTPQEWVEAAGRVLRQQNQKRWGLYAPLNGKMWCIHVYCDEGAARRDAAHVCHQGKAEVRALVGRTANLDAEFQAERYEDWATDGDDYNW